MNSSHEYKSKFMSKGSLSNKIDSKYISAKKVVVKKNNKFIGIKDIKKYFDDNCEHRSFSGNELLNLGSQFHAHHQAKEGKRQCADKRCTLAKIWLHQNTAGIDQQAKTKPVA